MAQLNGARLLAGAIETAGVRRIFTLSGNQILPIYDACLDVGIELTDARHETAAALPCFAVESPRGLRDLAFHGSGGLLRESDVVMTFAAPDFARGFLADRTLASDCTVIQVASSPSEFLSSERVAVALEGEATAVLDQLAAAMPDYEWHGRGWSQEIEQAGSAGVAQLAALDWSSDVPIHPLRLVAELRQLLPRGIVRRARRRRVWASGRRAGRSPTAASASCSTGSSEWLVPPSPSPLPELSRIRTFRRSRSWATGDSVSTPWSSIPPYVTAYPSSPSSAMTRVGPRSAIGRSRHTAHTGLSRAISFRPDMTKSLGR